MAKPMELNINDERVFREPDATTIEREVSTLDEEQFAILKKDDETYIQAMVDPDEGMLLEYQDGSVEEHFGVAETPTKTAVVAAFLSYAAGTDEWKTRFEWARMELAAAEYTVFVSVPAERIGEIDDPFDWDERVELPDLDADSLFALYGLLMETSPEIVKSEFSVIAEIYPEGLDVVLLMNVPSRFQKALAALSQETSDALGASWQQADAFPVAEYDQDAAADLITDLANLAKRSLESGNILTMCLLQ